MKKLFLLVACLKPQGTRDVECAVLCLRQWWYYVLVIAAEVGMSAASAFSILTKVLRKKNVCAK